MEYAQQFIAKEYTTQDGQQVLVIGSHDAWAWIEQCEISLEMLLVDTYEDMPPLVIAAVEHDGVKVVSVITQGDLPHQ